MRQSTKEVCCEDEAWTSCNVCMSNIVHDVADNESFHQIPWVLHPVPATGTQANVLEPMKLVVWRAKKDQLDITTGRNWPDRQWTKRGTHTLNEFCHTFVDRPFLGEAGITETNTQSEAGSLAL